MHLGIWYDVTVENEKKKVKIVPSQRITEKQGYDEEYFNVLSKERSKKVLVEFNGTLQRCTEYVNSMYDLEEIPIEEYKRKLLEELNEDVKLLKKGSHSREWEMSKHISNLLSLIEA